MAAPTNPNTKINAECARIRPLEIFRTMDPHKADAIRQAYYKAAEGLAALAELLEEADAAQPQCEGPLLDEHFIACEAIEALNASELGRIL